jgi:type II secretory pathway pseudopilin PulG
MRRGSLLLEMVIALAVLVGGALTVLGAMRQGVSNAQRAAERMRAMDIAASTLAQIEAGIATPTELDGPVPSFEQDGVAAFDDLAPEPTPWERRIETDRSSFGALTSITVTVYRADEVTREPESGAARVTLSGLVRTARLLEDDENPEDAELRDLRRREGIR